MAFDPQPNTTPSSTKTLAVDEKRRNVDVEAQKPTKVSHLSIVLDQAGVTPEVLNHTYPGEGTAASPFLVDFLPQDLRNPLQFPQWKKWTITVLQAMATLAVAFVSTAGT